ncbi:hypothetical protein BU26DRAFT_254029, partial [Trematosphaeria pertusa]
WVDGGGRTQTPANVVTLGGRLGRGQNPAEFPPDDAIRRGTRLRTSPRHRHRRRQSIAVARCHPGRVSRARLLPCRFRLTLPSHTALRCPVPPPLPPTADSICGTTGPGTLRFYCAAPIRPQRRTVLVSSERFTIRHTHLGVALWTGPFEVDAPAASKTLRRTRTDSLRRRGRDGLLACGCKQSIRRSSTSPCIRPPQQLQPDARETTPFLQEGHALQCRPANSPNSQHHGGSKQDRNESKSGVHRTLAAEWRITAIWPSNWPSGSSALWTASTYHSVDTSNLQRMRTMIGRFVKVFCYWQFLPNSCYG